MSPIKNVAAPTAPKLKVLSNAAPADGDRLTKEGMLDRTWLVTLHEYTPDYEGQYGPSPRAIVDLREVDGDGEATRHWLWATAAKQVGEALEPGEVAVGKFVTMTSKGGREYSGWSWVSDPLVLAKAEERLTETLPF